MVLGFSMFSGGIERGINNSMKRLHPIDRTSLPDPMYRFDSLKVKPVTDISPVRQVSTSGPTQAAAAEPLPKPGDLAYRGTVPGNKGYMKIVKYQRLFLKNDGKLVWQKLGARDMVLYYGIVGMTAGCVAYTFLQIYNLANKK